MRRELSQGSVLTSLVGYDLTYNTLDNNRNPTSGTARGPQAGFRRCRRRRAIHSHHRRFPHLLRAHFGSRRRAASARRQYFRLGAKDPVNGTNLRMLDHFQMGPQLVRGFARRASDRATYTVQLQRYPRRRARRFALLGRQRRIPDAAVLCSEGCRHQGGGFRRCRLGLGLQGPTSGCRRFRGATGEVLTTSLPGGVNSATNMFINSSVGVGLLLGIAVRTAAFRSGLSR